MTFHKLVPNTLQNAAAPFDTPVPGETGYFAGSPAVTTGGLVYVGNDNSKLYQLSANDLSKITSYETGTGGDDYHISSSPAIGYNVDDNHNRWVFITRRGPDGDGKLYAFKTVR
ncbi:MAG: hypothetical protein A2Z18_02735 [Armatimonadetes bacterium RBG_16_58_9]|nr:MAG: hypothetical protein A2Z18_02735 [Armatimonadetes bacterium RBG_16_58_9]